MFVESAG